MTNLSAYSEDHGPSIPQVEGSCPSTRSTNPILGTLSCPGNKKKI